MAEIQMLTEEAKKTRFDFVWRVEGYQWVLGGQVECERALRRSLEMALQMHGALDFGLANLEWRL